MKRESGPSAFLCSLTVLALLGLAWQLAINMGHIPAYNMSSPATTIRTIVDNPGMITQRCASTLEGAVAGLAASVTVALLLALLVVPWPRLSRAVAAYALLVRTLPIVGVAPLVTLIAGRGLPTSVLCVGIVTVFALYVAAVEGLQNIPSPVHDLTRLYGTSFLRAAVRTWLPSAWGGLVVGLRIAGPLAVLAAVLAEWLSGRSGVGSLMVTAQADRDTPLLWAATVSAAVLGLLAFAVPGVLAGLVARRGFSPEDARL